MTEWIVRPVKDREELDRAFAIGTAAIDVPENDERSALVRERFDADRDIDMVAVINETIVACALGYRDELGVFIHLLATAGPWRGSGVGTQLVEAVVAAAREAGDERVYADNTADVVDFYRRAGFNECASCDGSPGVMDFPLA